MDGSPQVRTVNGMRRPRHLVVLPVLAVAAGVFVSHLTPDSSLAAGGVQSAPPAAIEFCTMWPGLVVTNPFGGGSELSRDSVKVWRSDLGALKESASAGQAQALAVLMGELDAAKVKLDGMNWSPVAVAAAAARFSSAPGVVGAFNAITASCDGVDVAATLPPVG